MSIGYSRIQAYALAALAVFVALAVKSVIEPHLSLQSPFIAFLAAIMFVAWAWGFAPAVFATVLSAIVIDYSIIPPLNAFTLTAPDLGSIFFFCAVGTTMAYTIHRLQTRQREAVALGRQLEDLHRLSTQLFEERDVEHTFDGILAVALELLDADKGLIQLYEPRDNTLRLMAQVGFTTEFCRQLERVGSDFSCRVAAFQRRQRVIIENIATDGEFSKLAPLFSACHVVSAQATPLFGADGAALGVVTTYSATPRVPSQRHLHLFDLFAQQAARILETRQTHESLSEANELLEYHVSATEERLQKALTDLAITEERERHNLALELHDYLAQLLTFANLKVHAAVSMLKSSPDKAEQHMKQVATALQRSMMYTRTLMAELIPPELHSSGLPTALTWLAGQMGKHGLTVELHMNVESLPLPHDQAALLYRSVRELLINVTKHAGTDHATVSLTVDADQTLVIEVHDRGSGYDPAALKVSTGSRTFGLASIRERMSALGGWCRPQSAVGVGTTVTLGLPLERPHQFSSLRAAATIAQDRLKTKPSSLTPQPGLPFESSLENEKTTNGGKTT